MIDYILLEKYTENLNVLLVDDDTSVQEETKELLADIFNFVETAFDGKEAIDKYKNFHNENGIYFDIVISDVHMPNVNGVELTKFIYECNPNQNLVIISAYSDPKDLIEFINLGVSQFISKPIEINKFIKILFEISEKIYNSNEVFIDKKSAMIVLSNSVVWDSENKKLFKNNTLIKLTKREILLISLLLQVEDKTYSIDEIIRTLWGDDISADITNLKNVISRLRKKVPELIIENIYGLGYKISHCK